MVGGDCFRTATVTAHFTQPVADRHRRPALLLDAYCSRAGIVAALGCQRQSRAQRRRSSGVLLVRGSASPRAGTVLVLAAAGLRLRRVLPARSDRSPSFGGWRLRLPEQERAAMRGSLPVVLHNGSDLAVELLDRVFRFPACRMGTREFRSVVRRRERCRPGRRRTPRFVHLGTRTGLPVWRRPFVERRPVSCACRPGRRRPEVATAGRILTVLASDRLGALGRALLVLRLDSEVCGAAAAARPGRGASRPHLRAGRVRC